MISSGVGAVGEQQRWGKEVATGRSSLMTNSAEQRNSSVKPFGVTSQNELAIDESNFAQQILVLENPDDHVPQTYHDSNAGKLNPTTNRFEEDEALEEKKNQFHSLRQVTGNFIKEEDDDESKAIETLIREEEEAGPREDFFE